MDTKTISNILLFILSCLSGWTLTTVSANNTKLVTVEAAVKYNTAACKNIPDMKTDIACMRQSMKACEKWLGE